LVGALLLILGALSLAVYTGLYNVAADVPHSQPVYWLLQTIRGRSIAVRVRDVVVPADLNNAKRIDSGAAEYAEMCSGCHLAPGMEIRQVFLGSSRDYMVEAQDGTQLRIVTETDGSIAPGAPVWLRMPPERCRALAG
jgi:hypothetical protein